MVMVKPGIPYLDIVRRVKDRFGADFRLPGQRGIRDAGNFQNGWLDERSACWNRCRLQARRADGVLTYFALDAAQWLRR